MAILVSELRSLRSQGNLFPVLSSIEAQAVRLAVEEYESDLKIITIHVLEWRASQELQDAKQAEAEMRRRQIRRAA